MAASATTRGPIALAIKGQMVRAALSVPTNIVEGSAKEMKLRPQIGLQLTVTK